jgi:DNA-binding transcriptional LysR family regulator
MDWRTIQFDWNRARAFLVTVEEGSFSAAARALGTTQPTIGRQVAQLEDELGVTLFERVGNTLEPTESALDLLDHVRAMGEAANRFSLVASGRETEIAGSVAITASEAITAFMLPAIVAELRREQPGIEIELVATNETRDLTRREADIAIRNFAPEQADLVGRKLGMARAGLYAAPTYLERVGPIESFDDITKVEIFGFDRGEVMISGLRQLGLEMRPEQFPVIAQSHLVQWEMCRRGVGICIMMECAGEPEPGVVRVLPEIAISFPMWLVSHRELQTSRRIRLVYDLLAERLGDML